VLPEPDPEMVYLNAWIPEKEIHYLRFLMEGYEGILTLSSEPASSRVTFQIPASRAEEARTLLEALRQEIGLVLLPGEGPVSPT
jgi:hypothetical protein